MKPKKPKRKKVKSKRWVEIAARLVETAADGFRAEKR